jgi:hypothetical protein
MKEIFLVWKNTRRKKWKEKVVLQREENSIA